MAGKGNITPATFVGVLVLERMWDLSAPLKSLRKGRMGLLF